MPASRLLEHYGDKIMMFAGNEMGEVLNHLENLVLDDKLSRCVCYFALTINRDFTKTFISGISGSLTWRFAVWPGRFQAADTVIFYSDSE